MNQFIKLYRVIHKYLQDFWPLRYSSQNDHARKWTGLSRPACLFRSAQAATLLEFHVTHTNCFARRWFCVVRGPKPPLHRHNWLSFGKFQDTERFLIPCPRHVSSRLPPSGETCKYATAPRTQKKIGEIFYLLICSPSTWPSWLLYRRGRRSRKELWITLYTHIFGSKMDNVRE
jgi:hypothetical protein